MKVEAAIAIVAILGLAFFAGFQANALAKPAAPTPFAFIEASPEPSVQLRDGETKIVSMHVPAVGKNNQGGLAKRQPLLFSFHRRAGSRRVERWSVGSSSYCRAAVWKENQKRVHNDGKRGRAR